MPHPPIISSLLKSRRSIVELIIAAVFLALGVNLLATIIANMFETGAACLLWISLALVLTSVALIAHRTFAATRVSSSLEGFFCYDPTTNELVRVPRYTYSEQLSGYFDGLFAENDAPRKLWATDPLSGALKHDKSTGTWEDRATAAGQLIIEATEYFVLERLSTHLGGYFNSAEVDKEQLRELTREDVLGLVFKNRFLDTFCRPMEERAAFVDITLTRTSSIGKLRLAVRPSGVRYAEFNLVLPAGAQVSRSSPTSIEIDTPRFSLTIKIGFDAYNTTLPRGFDSLYLEGRSPSNVSAYKVDVTTLVRFKPLSLLSQSGWQYHTWVDSFLSSLEDAFSADEFFRLIDWDRAMTVARVMERILADTPTKTGVSGDPA